MDKPFKFVLPSPDFDKKARDACKLKPHYLTPSGMSLLPREKHPPPMYGKHGATLPARYLKHFEKEQQFATSATLNPPEKQYCEPCELELHSLDDLKRHRAQHEKCPVEACHYRGHPSVMDKHVNTLHASGLFDKFKKLSTPEEIAAWREERRKRYPTLANVLLKQRAKEQRQKRGERLESSKNRFGNLNDRKRAHPTQEDETKHKYNKTNHKNKRNQKNKHKKPKKEVLNPKEQNGKEKFEEKNDLSCVGIEMFRGTCLLENYKHFSNKKNAVTNNVLYGLVGMYGSDDDQESEESDGGNAGNVKNIDTVKETKIYENNCDMIVEKSEQVANIEIIRTNNESTKIHEISLNNVSTEVLKSSTNDLPKSLINSNGIGKNGVPINDTTTFDSSPVEKYAINDTIENVTYNQNDGSSDEAPDEKPIQRSNLDFSLISVNNPNTKNFGEPKVKGSKLIEPTTTSKQKKIIRKSGLDYRKARLRKQNTMLEKLLESDIRHERNVLLQCVRFVCENNFFNIGENKNQESLAKYKT